MTRSYESDCIAIERLSIEGVRIDRIHGNSYFVYPRLYSVRDDNLKAKGPWIVELHNKQVPNKDGTSHEATVVTISLAPKRASKHMASLTRQSIMVQPAGQGTYRGRPYAHVTFRDPEALGGKETAGRGEKDLLPAWFKRRYGRRLRLRRTVQGKVTSTHEVGKRLAKYHDIKQVVVFDDWQDEEFIKLFFAMRVFAAETGFGLK